MLLSSPSASCSYPTLFLVSVLIFSLQQLMPGDPALVMAGEERDPHVHGADPRDYWLDRPMPVQYFHWIAACCGRPRLFLAHQRAGARADAQKLPVTMQLASMAFVIALLIGVPAGMCRR